MNFQETYTVLFRGNSVASKMLFQFAMDVGKQYLIEVLKVPVNNLVRNISSLEVNILFFVTYKLD